MLKPIVKISSLLMPLLNYTTKIDADKTAGEISKILRGIGAASILTDYDPTGEFISAISFRVNLEGQEISFRLPCDWQPTLAVLTQQRQRNARIQVTQEQAVRVSWRIIKDWVEAQAALIETRMVNTVQVFLPYAMVGPNETLYQKMAADPQLLLGTGS